MIAMFAGIGLPGFSGFIGEFLSLLGTFVSERPWAVVGATGVILASVYMLWAFQKVFTGKPPGEHPKLKDLHLREIVGRRAAARAQPLPRPLPEAGARPHRAVGEALDREPRAQDPTTRSSGPRAPTGPSSTA